MYSNHITVNILTALLREHGVRHAVVCPGSRNAPIVHNLDACPEISCYGVTDERSAGFYALGLAQATGQAVAVCVTSGSALLNVIPAVAEASFQHVPLIVISADRPAAWIGQLDGQTMPQPNALQQWVKCAVSLPELKGLEREASPLTPLQRERGMVTSEEYSECAELLHPQISSAEFPNSAAVTTGDLQSPAEGFNPTEEFPTPCRGGARGGVSAPDNRSEIFELISDRRSNNLLFPSASDRWFQPQAADTSEATPTESTQTLKDFEKDFVGFPAEGCRPTEENLDTIPLAFRRGVRGEALCYCARLINEALIATKRGGGGPVHINVPLNEPLFGFDTPQLPDVKAITCIPQGHAVPDLEPFLQKWQLAQRRMIIIGQTTPDEIDDTAVKMLSNEAVVLHESLAGVTNCIAHPEQVIERIGDRAEAQPDMVVYLGGSIVSKKLKQWLRGNQKAEQWRVETDGSMPDTFCHLTGLIEAAPSAFLKALATHKGENRDIREIRAENTSEAFLTLWQETEAEVASELAEEDLAFSEKAVVRYLEQQIEDLYTDIATHYANSTPVRLANLYAWHHVWCNRGLNGIEGSLSTAAGFSLAYDGLVVCVTGDLSFFYDQNALWPKQLGGNLRIVLLNNGGGKIFRQLPGLSQSKAIDSFISGRHNRSARGICEQFDIGYLHADNWDDARMGIVSLLTREANRPMVLEMFF